MGPNVLNKRVRLLAFICFEQIQDDPYNSIMCNTKRCFFMQALDAVEQPSCCDD